MIALSTNLAYVEFDGTLKVASFLISCSLVIGLILLNFQILKDFKRSTFREEMPLILYETYLNDFKLDKDTVKFRACHYYSLINNVKKYLCVIAIVFF
jgi:hypothetical protein